MTPRLLVNIDVPDLRLAEPFYVRAFELKCGRRFGEHGVELLGAGVAIYLLTKTAGSRANTSSTQTRDYARHWTPVHLDFVVEDVDAAVIRAIAAGAVLEDPITSHRWGRIAHLADPFGNGFCLLQFLGRGYDEIAEQPLD